MTSHPAARGHHGTRPPSAGVGALHWYASLFCTWRGYALATLAVFLVVLAVVQYPAAWSAAHGGGIRGSFVADRSLSCGRGLGTGCGWSGVFDADDGSTHATVTLDAAAPGRVGGQVTVRFVPSNPGVVYLAEGDRTWVWMLTVGSGSAMYVLVFAGAVLIRGRAFGPRAALPAMPTRRHGSARHAR